MMGFSPEGIPPFFCKATWAWIKVSSSLFGEPGDSGLSQCLMWGFVLKNINNNFIV